MTGHLRVTRHAKVAIRHPTEQKGVVFGEVEDMGRAIGLADMKVDRVHWQILDRYEAEILK